MDGDDSQHEGHSAWRPPAVGLRFRSATTVDDVIAAWRLTYRAYRRKELIAANRQQIFTTENAVRPQSLVLLGQIGPVIVSTLTATIEATPRAIMSDRLLGPGRRTVHLQLMADRRAEADRCEGALLQMLALGWNWGRRQQATDCLLTVEPTMTAYFRHAFGFDAVAGPRSAEAAEARDPRAAHAPHAPAPLAMLCCDIAAMVSHPQPPAGMRFLLDQQTPAHVFDQPYAFDPGEIARSPIGDFLSEKYTVRAAG